MERPDPKQPRRSAHAPTTTTTTKRRAATAGVRVKTNVRAGVTASDDWESRV